MPLNPKTILEPTSNRKIIGMCKKHVKHFCLAQHHPRLTGVPSWHPFTCFQRLRSKTACQLPPCVAFLYGLHLKAAYRTSHVYHFERVLATTSRLFNVFHFPGHRNWNRNPACHAARMPTHSAAATAYRKAIAAPQRLIVFRKIDAH